MTCGFSFHYSASSLKVRARRFIQDALPRAQAARITNLSYSPQMQHQRDIRIAPSKERRPGFVLIGAFLLFGATAALLAGTSLAWQGTPLDKIWVLNMKAQRQLAPIGKQAGIGFLILGTFMALAGVGWFRRRPWAWKLAIGIFAVQLLGDLVNFLKGEFVGGLIGCVIAGTLLAYLLRSEIHACFRETGLGNRS